MKKRSLKRILEQLDLDVMTGRVSTIVDQLFGGCL